MYDKRMSEFPEICNFYIFFFAAGRRTVRHQVESITVPPAKASPNSKAVFFSIELLYTIVWDAMFLNCCNCN